MLEEILFVWRFDNFTITSKLEFASNLRWIHRRWTLDFAEWPHQNNTIVVIDEVDKCWPHDVEVTEQFTWNIQTPIFDMSTRPNDEYLTFNLSNFICWGFLSLMTSNLIVIHQRIELQVEDLNSRIRLSIKNVDRPWFLLEDKNWWDFITFQNLRTKFVRGEWMNDTKV